MTTKQTIRRGALGVFAASLAAVLLATGTPRNAGAHGGNEECEPARYLPLPVSRTYTANPTNLEAAVSRGETLRFAWHKSQAQRFIPNETIWMVRRVEGTQNSWNFTRLDGTIIWMKKELWSLSGRGLMIGMPTLYYIHGWHPGSVMHRLECNHVSERGAPVGNRQVSPETQDRQREEDWQVIRALNDLTLDDLR